MDTFIQVGSPIAEESDVSAYLLRREEALTLKIVLRRARRMHSKTLSVWGTKIPTGLSRKESWLFATTRLSPNFCHSALMKGY
jgi:hypothetical protein